MYPLFFRENEVKYVAHKDIRVYRTHITISPYALHESNELELYLSIKDKPTHSLIPIGYYYDEYDRVMYIPRGVPLSMLELWFHSKPYQVQDDYKALKLKKGKMVVPPRSEIQKESIDFLLQTGKYKNTIHYTQLGLNLPTGTGKTYCAIHALISKRERALIVCHTARIRNQWKEKIIEYTTVDPDRILIIQGRNVMDKVMMGELDPDDYDYFITLHHSLFRYASAEGWHYVRAFVQELRVDTKIIDESHLYFENSLMLDFFTDVHMTYYMTATFGRSDIRQRQLYEKVYSTMFRFGNKVTNEQHTITTIILIDSHPESSERRGIEYATAYGFSLQKYQYYQMASDSNAMKKGILKAMECCQNSEGIGLITSGLIESVEWISNFVQNDYPDKRCIAVHSKSERIELDRDTVDVISATSKYIGTGNDIPGLRYIVATEPMGSIINIKQLMGRLRPYYDSDGNQKDTYFFYILDMAFPKCRGMYERIYPTMKQLSKKMYSIDLR